MTTAWWWFVAMNAVVVAIALLSSSRARPSLVQSPRRQRSGVTLTRRASSAVLQSLLSFSVFSFPSTCLSPYLQPDAATTDRETETEELTVRSSPIKPSASPRALQLSAPSPATAADEEEEEEDPNAMSMDEAYALVLASQQRPEREREEDARRSEVDAKAEEFIRSFKEELRQQRLKSTSN
ncbi:uncharacterized protein [Zea mays]|jgi:hypothetical protein|uniref:Uncharacterized protein n=1 Tax=Zea mays TaxID=4577 RepID=A0A1D6I383_MAIZE|nr:uncharacterized protein LOC109940845 [Zea mays]ONM54615.1 hypothetical protein ZEAMMB73_Zm00001d020250 [Zea mays]|eukprot:XP_020396767.1 uncharacterized protein LOC109940845 [Zea mays]